MPPVHSIARQVTASALRRQVAALPRAHPVQIRPITQSHTLRSASHGHEDQYDPPGGWLWGQRPGEKVEKEGWEGIWTYGFFGAMAFLVVGYCYKPDTSIQTWALEEARRRLEVEGILPDPSKSTE